MESVDQNPAVPDVKFMMVDIETLGVNRDAPIIQLGAVIFNYSGIISTRNWNIEFPRSLQYADISTILWWMDRPKEIRDQVFCTFDRVSLARALNEFCELYKQHSPKTVWSKGPDFDLVLLQEKLKFFPDLEVPWKYSAKRDYRTAAKMFSDIPPVRPGAVHSADQDAIDQANHLIRIIADVGGSLE